MAKPITKIIMIYRYQGVGTIIGFIALAVGSNDNTGLGAAFGVRRLSTHVIIFSPDVTANAVIPVIRPFLISESNFFFRFRGGIKLNPPLINSLQEE